MTRMECTPDGQSIGAIDPPSFKSTSKSWNWNRRTWAAAAVIGVGAGKAGGSYGVTLKRGGRMREMNWGMAPYRGEGRER